MKRRSIGLLIAASLILTSCQPSTLISSLDAVIGAAELALPVIGAVTGVPPSVIAAIGGYLQAVDGAVGQASTILAGTGTDAEKSAAILQAFTGIAAGCNCIPAGTPSAVVNVIDAVVKAVARFLSHFAGQSSMTAGTPHKQPKPIKISDADRKSLADIKTRAEQHSVKVKAIQ